MSNAEKDRRAAKAAIDLAVASLVVFIIFLALGFFVLTPMHDRYVQEHHQTCEVQR